jgi:hypothetical protein
MEMNQNCGRSMLFMRFGNDFMGWSGDALRYKLNPALHDWIAWLDAKVDGD